jgi:hypothetical protein
LDKVLAPSSPADIRGKVFKGDAPDKLWIGDLEQAFSII